ncbi:MAG: hypothetical protein V3W20_13395 [Candidatus Neomarinimicrobiota bacterium]
MNNSEWEKVDFQQFVKDFGIEVVINNAPIILYSKKDKEHEAYTSLIAFFFVASGLLIYISLSLFLFEVYFSIIVFITVISLAIVVDIVLILNYIKSNVFIRPKECWVEIYKNNDYYCFSYYIIFTGKCHPNKAKSIIFKLYQDEVLKSTMDITQIEFYLKINTNDTNDINCLGFFFEYGEGKPFWKEEINHNKWQFFPYDISKNENYIAIANWAHQYEWRNDLELDFDKLHEYAPWVIKRWNMDNLKSLSESFKKTVKWNLRYLESTPKLKPWEGDLENQAYEISNATWETDIINDAIKNVIGEEYRVEVLKDLKLDLFELKAYFRDLSV